MRRCAAAREPARAERNTSRRSPAAAGGTVSSSGMPGRPAGLMTAARRAFEPEDQRQHAERDRHVGVVERREVRELHEVRDGTVAGTVDEVAERTPEEQSRR